MSASEPLSSVAACVFDAYGTLFDVVSAAEQCRDALGDKADRLAAVWRTKQLEYTWMRSLRGDYEDFWHVTGQSLDYAMAAVDLKDDALRARLMELYLILDAYPEVSDVLKAIAGGGFKTAVLSNGSPTMLTAAVRNAQLQDVLDDVISVDPLQVYKPHPSVYQSAVDRLKVPAERICFLSSNAWDAWSASQFGFRVVWINRFGQPPEQIPAPPEHEITTLRALPPLLGL